MKRAVSTRSPVPRSRSTASKARFAHDDARCLSGMARRDCGRRRRCPTDASLVFIPVSRLCMDLEARQRQLHPGHGFCRRECRAASCRADAVGGALVAWDIAGEKPAWSVDGDDFRSQAACSPASGLVFYGTLDGAFKALDAQNGRELWRFQASSGIIGQPIAFQGPDGRPYVAVLAGLGGPFGTVVRQRHRQARRHRGSRHGECARRPARAGGSRRDAVRVRPAMRPHSLASLAADRCSPPASARSATCGSIRPSLDALDEVAAMANGIGGAPPDVYVAMGQPYETNAYQLSQGKRLYEWFNCTGLPRQRRRQRRARRSSTAGGATDRTPSRSSSRSATVGRTACRPIATSSPRSRSGS